MKTKEEILRSSLVYGAMRNGEVHGETSEITKAMDEWAKQQAIAFIKYNCPDIKFDDVLLNAGYAGFIISQNQNK